MDHLSDTTELETHTFKIGVIRHYGEDKMEQQATPNMIEWTKIEQSKPRMVKAITKEKFIMEITPEGSEEQNGVSKVYLAHAPFCKWNKIVMANKQGIVATVWVKDTTPRWEKYLGRKNKRNMCHKKCCNQLKKNFKRREENTRGQRHMNRLMNETINSYSGFSGKIQNKRILNQDPFIPRWFFTEDETESTLTWTIPVSSLNEAIFKGMDESANHYCPDFEIDSEGEFHRRVPQKTMEKLFYIHEDEPERETSALEWETSTKDTENQQITVLGHGFRLNICHPEQSTGKEENTVTNIRRIYSKTDRWTKIMIENKQGPVAIIQLATGNTLDGPEDYNTSMQEIKEKRTKQPIAEAQKHTMERASKILHNNKPMTEQIKELHSLFTSSDPMLAQITTQNEEINVENIYHVCRSYSFLNELKEKGTSNLPSDPAGEQDSNPGPDARELTGTETFVTGMLTGVLVNFIKDYLLS